MSSNDKLKIEPNTFPTTLISFCIIFYLFFIIFIEHNTILSKSTLRKLSCENLSTSQKTSFYEITKQNGSTTTSLRLLSGSQSTLTVSLAKKRRSSVVREKWANKLEFLLAVIGYAVDLGNIWR